MNSEIYEIIIKVLSGDASPSDKQKLCAWLDLDQANMEIFKQTESVWNSFEIINTGKEYDSEQAFERFKNKVISRSKKSRRTRFIKNLDIVLRAAAVIIILFGIGFLFIKPEENIVSFGDSTFEVISPQGSKTQVSLPDGSKVWLNSVSKIHYTGSYNQTERVVFLEGEGYFEVQKDNSKPFIVATSDLKIKALGTIFNVKSYPGENTIETTLIEGKLQLESDASGQTSTLITLKPNQKVTYFKESQNIREEKPLIEQIIKDSAALILEPLPGKIISNEIVDPTVMTAWKNNIIYFDNEEFQDLAVRLERRFGVKFHFVNEDLKTLRFTGKFPDLIIEQVLAALQFASPFYYKFDDEDIYLSDDPVDEMTTGNTN